MRQVRKKVLTKFITLGDSSVEVAGVGGNDGDDDVEDPMILLWGVSSSNSPWWFMTHTHQAETKKKMESGWGNYIVSVPRIIDTYEQLGCPKCKHGMLISVLLIIYSPLVTLQCTDIHYQASTVDIELGCTNCQHVILFDALASRDILNQTVDAAVSAGLAHTQTSRFLAALDIQPCSNRKFITRSREIIPIVHAELDESIASVRQALWVESPSGDIDLIVFDERWSSQGYNAEEATFTAVWRGMIIAYQHVMRKSHLKG